MKMKQITKPYAKLVINRIAIKILLIVCIAYECLEQIVSYEDVKLIDTAIYAYPIMFMINIIIPIGYPTSLKCFNLRDDTNANQRI